MKTFFLFVLLCITNLLFVSIGSNAQSLPKTAIGKVYQNSGSIEFNINATQPFYVGANVFVLHIGSSSFDLYHQTDIEGKGCLAFIIPKNQFDQLKESAPIFLTYGNVFNSDASLEEKQVAVRESPEFCQYLGLFSTKMLVK